MVRQGQKSLKQEFYLFKHKLVNDQLRVHEIKLKDPRITNCLTKFPNSQDQLDYIINRKEKKMKTSYSSFRVIRPLDKLMKTASGAPRARSIAKHLLSTAICRGVL